MLTTKAEHGACPELVTPEVVRAAGPVDTVAMHLDLDGLYSGAKWVLGGVEPYEGADADARAIDTRRGEPGPIANRIDRALRARFRDETLKHRVIQYLLARTKAPVLWGEIEEAAREIDPLLDESKRLADEYQIIDGVAYVESAGRPYDKTELLLIGQERSPVAVVRDSGALTIAADFESGLDFVKMFDLGGGMPTRVTVPEARRAEVMSKLAAAVAARARPGRRPGVRSGKWPTRRQPKPPHAPIWRWRRACCRRRAGCAPAWRRRGRCRRATTSACWSRSCWRCCSPSRIAWGPTAAACASTWPRRSAPSRRIWRRRSSWACTGSAPARIAAAESARGGRAR